MENCYVEEYLKVATNDSLLGIGEAYFGYAKAGSIVTFKLFRGSVEGEISLRLVGSGFFSDSQGTSLGVDTISISSGSETFVYVNATGGDTHIIISNPTYNAPLVTINDSNFYGDLTEYYKYRNIRQNSDFQNMKASLNLDEIKGLGNGHLKFTNCENVTGNINRFSGLTEIRVNNTKCSGNLNNLDWSLLGTVGTFGSNVGGNIETLGQQVPETRTLNLFIGYSPITGSLEKFCENQLAKGRTATITVGVGNSNATFHGSTTLLNGINTKLEFATNSITIKNNSTNAVLATYDGSTWTYA